MPAASPDSDRDRAVPRGPAPDEAFSTIISGRLVPPRRSRAWHLLGLCTGLVLLPHGVAALARLLGLRRRATLTLGSDALIVETRVELLGSTVTASDLRLRPEAVAGAGVARTQPAGLLLAGAAVGIALALLGLKLLADGILVQAASLALAGGGVLCLGLGVDLAVFALGRFLAARRGVDVSIVTLAGPLVTVAGVEPARATRFARAVIAAGGAAPTVTVPRA